MAFEASLSRRFAAHLRRSGMLPAGETVVVALSGGLDSVALLHLLRFAAGRRPLLAAHFDHAMREGSAADARWVRGLCRAWGVTLVEERAAEAPRTEAEARMARYAFLERAAAQAGTGRIATAHHLDDQAETVLFRAARGAGLRGLRGILPARGPVVRPLLPFTRAELEAYAHAVRLRWREDPSNASPAYARNRLRARVLPELEAAVPGAARSLARLAAQARAAEQAWEHVLDALLESVLLTQSDEGAEVARERLLAYPSEVQGRLLRHLLRRHGFAPGWAGTRAAVEFIRSGVSGGGLQLGGALRLEREFDRVLLFWRPSESTAEPGAVLLDAARGEAEAVIAGERRRVRWGVAQNAQEAPFGDACEAFDPAAVRFPLELRGWRPGDRVRLAGGTKKLKKLFLERRIGRGARSRAPVLAQADGSVLWVVGVARASGARPVPGQPALYVTVSDVGR